MQRQVHLYWDAQAAPPVTTLFIKQTDTTGIFFPAVLFPEINTF